MAGQQNIKEDWRNIMDNSLEFARAVMALVDEFPSEPFSYERRTLEEKIATAVNRHSQQIDDELDTSFSLGLDQGIEQGYAEAKEEFEEKIQELEERITELEQNTKQEIEVAFAEGYEAGRLEYGLN